MTSEYWLVLTVAAAFLLLGIAGSPWPGSFSTTAGHAWKSQWTESTSTCSSN